jgi:threonine/homoserine/homoserine lactone efflux protein
MTALQAILGFSVVAGLLTIIPGLDTTLVLKSALSRSTSYAVAAGLGIIAGAFIWGAAAAVGAAALLQASELAYRIVTIAGSAYVVVLGVMLIVKAIRGEKTDPAEAAAAQPRRSLWRAALSGLVSNLLNPKVGVFYVATIPLFIPAGWAPAAGGLLLAAVHGLLTAVWFAIIIVGAKFVGRWLQTRRGRRIIDAVSGVALTGFGIKLLVDARWT